MKITILGAAGGEVTGSAYLVDTPQARLLVDLGLFQGGKKADELNRVPLGPLLAGLDAVVLTHAHLDHTGRLPLLARIGFKGPIFATPATIEMTGLILRDSAKIQAMEADRHNRKFLRPGEVAAQPLYTIGHVERVLSLLTPVVYREPVRVATGVRAIFVEAGHMLGSSSVQLLVEDGDVERKVVFSGDLGPKGALILRDFEPFAQADLLFLESTYGNRDHRPFDATVVEFVEILKKAIAEKGKVLIPTFAVGRAQILTTLVAWIFRQKFLEPFPVFLDSPMAIEATRIYARHPELFDEVMVAFLKAHPIAEDLATLKMTSTPEESKMINEIAGPCLVMAAGGMCNAGRILHHLRNNLGNPATHLIFVGYQAPRTLGRLLIDGIKEVTLFGQRIPVRAQIHTLGGFSAHAGQSDLLNWFGAMATSKPRVILTHGEDVPRTALGVLISLHHEITPELPALGEVIEV